MHCEFRHGGTSKQNVLTQRKRSWSLDRRVVLECEDFDNQTVPKFSKILAENPDRTLV